MKYKLIDYLINNGATPGTELIDYLYPDYDGMSNSLELDYFYKLLDDCSDLIKIYPNDIGVSVKGACLYRRGLLND